MPGAPQPLARPHHRRHAGPAGAAAPAAARPAPGPTPRGGAPAAPLSSFLPRRGTGATATRRHVVAAAAVTGGTLALTVPLAALLGDGEMAGADVAALQLSAVGTHGGAAPTVRGVAHTMLPVAAATEPAPTADAAGLIKAAGLADVARRAPESQARADCGADVSGLGGVKPWVSAAARFLSCLYDQPDLIGVSGRGRVSDHPLGLAVDLMAHGTQGDRIAECALRNQDALGISYVIWKQRINYGDGWHPMANRGSATENHFDHVHVSFARGAGSGTPDPGLCH